MKNEMNNEALQANLKMLNKQGEFVMESVRPHNPEAAEKFEKLSNLLENEAFIKSFVSSASAEDAAALFAENGLELTVDEVQLLAKQLHNIIEKLFENGGELSEEDLEQIAGGRSFNLQDLKNGAGFSVIGAGIGTLVAPGIGTAAGIAIGAVSGIIIGTPIADGAKAVKKFFKWLF